MPRGHSSQTNGGKQSFPIGFAAVFPKGGGQKNVSAFFDVRVCFPQGGTATPQGPPVGLLKSGPKVSPMSAGRRPRRFSTRRWHNPIDACQRTTSAKPRMATSRFRRTYPQRNPQDFSDVPVPKPFWAASIGRLSAAWGRNHEYGPGGGQRHPCRSLSPDPGHALSLGGSGPWNGWNDDTGLWGRPASTPTPKLTVDPTASQWDG